MPHSILVLVHGERQPDPSDLHQTLSTRPTTFNTTRTSRRDSTSTDSNRLQPSVSSAHTYAKDFKTKPEIIKHLNKQHSHLGIIHCHAIFVDHLHQLQAPSIAIQFPKPLPPRKTRRIASFLTHYLHACLLNLVIIAMQSAAAFFPLLPTLKTTGDLRSNYVLKRYLLVLRSPYALPCAPDLAAQSSPYLSQIPSPSPEQTRLSEPSNFADLFADTFNPNLHLNSVSNHSKASLSKGFKVWLFFVVSVFSRT
jgi:hypothetical protein